MAGYDEDMENSRSLILCPSCPVCCGPAVLPFPGLSPWFCGNDDCDVFAWDPHATLEENLMDARPIDVVEVVPEE